MRKTFYFYDHFMMCYLEPETPEEIEFRREEIKEVLKTLEASEKSKQKHFTDLREEAIKIADSNNIGHRKDGYFFNRPKIIRKLLEDAGWKYTYIPIGP